MTKEPCGDEVSRKTFWSMSRPRGCTEGSEGHARVRERARQSASAQVRRAVARAGSAKPRAAEQLATLAEFGSGEDARHSPCHDLPGSARTSPHDVPNFSRTRPLAGTKLAEDFSGEPETEGGGATSKAWNAGGIAVRLDFISTLGSCKLAFLGGPTGSCTSHGGRVHHHLHEPVVFRFLDASPCHMISFGCQEC